MSQWKNPHWSTSTAHSKDREGHQVHVVTVIDPSTGWVEVASLRDGPTAAEAQRNLDAVWSAQQKSVLMVDQNSKQSPSNCTTAAQASKQDQVGLGILSQAPSWKEFTRHHKLH